MRDVTTENGAAGGPDGHLRKCYWPKTRSSIPQNIATTTKTSLNNLQEKSDIYTTLPHLQQILIAKYRAALCVSIVHISWGGQICTWVIFGLRDDRSGNILYGVLEWCSTGGKVQLRIKKGSAHLWPKTNMVERESRPLLQRTCYENEHICYKNHRA